MRVQADPVTEGFDFFEYFRALLDSPKDARFDQGGLDKLSWTVAVAIARNHEHGKPLKWWFVPIDLAEEHAYNDEGKRRLTLCGQTGMARPTVSARIQRLLDLHVIERLKGARGFGYKPVPPKLWRPRAHGITEGSFRSNRSQLSGDVSEVSVEKNGALRVIQHESNIENAKGIHTPGVGRTDAVASNKALEDFGSHLIAASSWVERRVNTKNDVEDSNALTRSIALCYADQCDQQGHGGLHGKKAMWFHRSVIADEKQALAAERARSRGGSDLATSRP